MFDLSAGGWLFACICGLVVGMTKCGLPGMGSLAVPLMASVLPAKTATGALLPILILGDMAGSAYFKRHANWRLLLKMLPIALLGILAGYALLGQPWMDDQVIRLSTAVIVLVLVLMNQVKNRLPILVAAMAGRPWMTWSLAVIFGLMAGITTMLANAAGPVMLVYLLTMGLPKDEFIGTNAWFFVILNWIKVPFMLDRGMINGDSLLFNCKLIPALALGCLLGIVLSKRMSNDRFKKWVEILTVIAALLLFLPPGFLSELARGWF